MRDTLAKQQYFKYPIEQKTSLAMGFELVLQFYKYETDLKFNQGAVGYPTNNRVGIVSISIDLVSSH